MALALGYVRHRLAAVLLVGLAASPLLAQEPAPPPAPPVADGELIYARDVRHSIGAPHFPGRVHTAVTAPTGTILGAVVTGLAPLSDSETASVTASVPAALPLGVAAQLGQLVPESGGAQVNAMPGAETATGAIGASIGRAMGALTGAMGSLSALTGGRP
jgi:hypothetical protein